MVTYLFYDTLCEEDEKDRIGGDAYLPGNINWPSHGNIPMLFLMTLSSNFLNKYANYEIPDSHCLSVFVPYAKGSIEGAIQLARTIDAATVLIHKTSSTPRQENKTPLNTCRKLRVEIHPDIEDEDEFSDEIEEKVGGVPTWLQDRIDYTDEYKFVLQYIAGEFEGYWTDHNELFLDGICYLFLREPFNLNDSQAGMFRIQYS